MRVVNSALLLAVILLLTAGTRGTEVTQAQIGQFKPGAASLADVESKLGLPQKTRPLDNGKTAVDYILLQEEANAASYVPLARLAAGGMNVHETRFEFTFDASGRLIGEETNQRDMVCIHKNCPTETTPWQPGKAR